ncbi:Molybdopterin molybdenumtransferase [Neolewinella maritima]|uniref:Molybdopterin molybdenumtransferase n=1 Tax=Neolewinella maritima TaxID=1383882 RepID=A0ABN8F5Y4_9BACT|nr:molybdopterin molybdotransferase MoeA [Neolewinella maritima]CAH0999464.1 Molybdopterin molybdenumtransferase [Neolewinella maritima]
MTDPQAALQLVLQQSFDWGNETIPLHAATGRVLRQTVHADRDQPPFDRVAMDGIAIDYAAYRSRRRFPVAHTAPAGTAPLPLTDPSHCVEVMTGAPLPPGTTTVIRYEDLQRDGDAFIVPEGVEDGRSIHRRANDGRAGDRVLEPGRYIGAAELAALATYGVGEVTVARRPRVAIASTGDEVVPVQQTPLPHQIRSSNVWQLAGLFRDVGIEPTVSHLSDEARLGQELLRQLLADHDLLLLNGGVSKGKLDHVPDWLATAGVEGLFHRVAQRPGKPLWVGRSTQTMVFALPGNPVSSLVGALAYVGPFLRQQLGVVRPARQAVLTREVTFVPDLQLFQQVSLASVSGEQRASPLDHGGSGDLLSLLRTDGFCVLPRGRTTFSAGEAFDFLPLSLR